MKLSTHVNDVFKDSVHFSLLQMNQFDKKKKQYNNRFKMQYDTFAPKPSLL